MQSEQINDLAAALAKAQGKITGALKDSTNPFFKSKYADLASCWDACRTQLSDNGLAVIQTTDVINGQLCVITTLTHMSGQWVRGNIPVKCKDDGPQAQGSGITYARRYALAAIVGLAQIDDDANGANKNPNASPLQSTTVPITDAQIVEIKRMLVAAGRSEAKLCEHMHLAALTDFSEADYEASKELLKSVISKSVQ